MGKKWLTFSFLFSIVVLLSGCSGLGKSLFTVWAQTEFKEADPKIETGEELTFMIGTDLHFLSEKINDHGAAFQTFAKTTEGKLIEYIDPINRVFFDEVTQKKPNVLILSGDLTNNGEKQSHLDMASMLKEVESAGTQVFVIPGNHDIMNPWGVEFKGNQIMATDHVEPKDFATIYNDFGYNEAISRDANSLSYLAAPSEDVWLLMLDTNIYENNYQQRHPSKGGEISNGTLSWMKECLEHAKKNGVKVIPVMHHNLIPHNPMFRDGFTLDNYEEAQALFDSYKANISLSGHVHVQDIASHQGDATKLYDIVTSSLAVFPHNYGVMTYSPGSSRVNYRTEEVDVEAWAERNDQQDENLLMFDQYSRTFFNEVAYGMAEDQLEKEGGVTTLEREVVSRTMEVISKNFFSGTEHLNEQEVFGTEGFEILMNLPNVYEKKYAENILFDEDMLDNELDVVLGGE